MNTNFLEPVILVISGPTASGKTELAIRLARFFYTEILSFDSRQFYKELTIGTAKPNQIQLSKVPHHFIGSHSITKEFNAEMFSKEARCKILEIQKTNKILILVGGSGLYLDSLLYSFDPIPRVPGFIRQSLIKLKEEKGIRALQDLLLEKDSIYYHKIDLNNPQRLIRALEVCLGTGKPFSSFRTSQKNALPGKIIKFSIYPEIKSLYETINTRVDSMIEMGLEKEVANFKDYEQNNALKSVGYAEFLDFFNRKLDREEVIPKIKQHTRNFAKRQLTWFRKDQENHFIRSLNIDEQFKNIISLLESENFIS